MTVMLINSSTGVTALMTPIVVEETNEGLKLWDTNATNVSVKSPRRLTDSSDLSLSVRVKNILEQLYSQGSVKITGELNWN